MASSRAETTAATRSASPPVPTSVRVTGGLMVLWCLAFAAANVVLASTGKLDRGDYAEYAAGLAVLNWLVLGLKLVGAGLALVAVLRQPRWPGSAWTGTLLWAAVGTLGLYAAGSVVEGVAIATGAMATDAPLTLRDIGYVVFFLAAAAGFAVLATSYTRRHRLGRRRAALGVLLGPVVLGAILLAVPALLVALGQMPSY